MPTVTQGRPPNTTVYQTTLGRVLQGKAEDLLASGALKRFEGAIQMIFTSPPFPLTSGKRYGNRTGEDYIDWLAEFGRPFRDLLRDDGSLVVEIGNAWEKGRPVMSTAPLRALLALMDRGGFQLCQEFIWDNPARLPSPAQWVNIERIRVKDSFTRIWWLGKQDKPKADNRAVLVEYSDSMKRLLKRKSYNSGTRPSEHSIGETSFLRNNGGAIPANVFHLSNTRSTDPYLDYCAEKEIRPHPARMPEALPEFFLKFLTDERDIVLDPFGGSNVTGAVAERLGRQWLTVEKRADYIEGSRGRFQQTPSV